MITKNQNAKPKIACVRLVQSVFIPSLKGRFLEVKVYHSDQLGCSVSNGSHVLFEPEVGLFEPLGLHSHESLVTVQDNGCVLVPVQNPEGTSVCLDEGLNVGVVRCITDCFEVRNYNGVEECNGVSGSSCEVLDEESLSDSVEGEVSSEVVVW